MFLDQVNYTLERRKCFHINRNITVVNLFLKLNDLGIRAWTSDYITGTVLALLMNRDTVISALHIA